MAITGAAVPVTNRTLSRSPLICAVDTTDSAKPLPHQGSQNTSVYKYKLQDVYHAYNPKVQRKINKGYMRI